MDPTRMDVPYFLFNLFKFLIEQNWKRKRPQRLMKIEGGFYDKLTFQKKVQTRKPLYSYSRVRTAEGKLKQEAIEQ